MEFFLVLISVPLFLLILLGFALFVLPRYSRLEQTRSTPPVGQAKAKRDSLQGRHAPDVSDDPLSLVGWGITLGIYVAIVVIAITSELNVHRRK